jgi:parvulin-like peptidyl-prolyl isomerase
MIRHSPCKLVRLITNASILFVFITFVSSPKDVFAQSLFSGPVVGQMGSVQITASQINSLLAAQTPETRKSYGEQPDAIKTLIRNELVRRMVISEALKVDWDKRTDVAVAIERSKEQAIIDNFVANRSLPPAGFPSEAEIKAAYDANIAQFRVPAQIRLAQILIRLPENANAGEVKRALATAQEISTKLDGGANFGELAKQYSQDESSKDNRGELDWLNENMLTAQFRTAVASLKGNASSKPIRSPFGYQIVKVVDRKPEFTRPLNEISDAIAKNLRDARTNQNREAYLEGLTKKTPPQVNDENLKAIRF